MASWLQNFSLYSILQHFSPFYVCCVGVSVAMVIFTWYFNDRITTTNHAQSMRQKSGFSTKCDKDHVKNSEFNVMSQMKRAKQKAIEKILTEELTEEQLAQEKEVESRQLSEIFKLLQDQEDKFHINTKEELQEQLKLYRSQ